MPLPGNSVRFRYLETIPQNPTAMSVQTHMVLGSMWIRMGDWFNPCRVASEGGAFSWSRRHGPHERSGTTGSEFTFCMFLLAVRP